MSTARLHHPIAKCVRHGLPSASTYRMIDCMARGQRRTLDRMLNTLHKPPTSWLIKTAAIPPVSSVARHYSLHSRCPLAPRSYTRASVLNTRVRHMSSQTSGRKDPTAKRPTKVCDPYGQSGKALSKLDAQGLMATLDEGWILEEAMSQQDHGGNACDDDSRMIDEMNGTSSSEATCTAPASICREYYHDNFITGSRFVAQVAAVAHNNNHYPCISLERRLMKREKAWRVVSVVKCFTPTLGGLSYNDFHLAMLVDVETARPEVAELLLGGDGSLKKHT